VDIKTKAYLDLFPYASAETHQKILEHHKNNGGMSRYRKIPLYLEWAGLKNSQDVVLSYEKRFASLVVDAVLASPWIPGVESILHRKTSTQKYVVVTGTPQEEIQEILHRLKIDSLFDRVYGAPKEKPDAIRETLMDWRVRKDKAIIIGDSESDYVAAKENGISFLYRDSGEASEFFKRYNGDRILNFVGMI
jgi:phosphoglycolate phosphatase-like HAD superfamily hydrolase